MPRALVIDDQSYVRTTVSTILRGQGFEVVEADGGNAGLTKLEQETFDVAIIDIYMPGMDGVQVIKLVRDRWPKLPLIAMSGVALNQSDLTALDFFAMKPELAEIPSIKKPFRPNQFMEVVRNAMSASRIESEKDNLLSRE